MFGDLSFPEGRAINKVKGRVEPIGRVKMESSIATPSLVVKRNYRTDRWS